MYLNNFPHLQDNYSNTFNFLKNFIRKIRIVRKTTTILGWTFLSIPFQAVFIRLPGRTKIRFACFYWYIVGKLFGLNCKIYGRIFSTITQSSSKKRPVLYIANHCSWLDIVTIGGITPGCFVAKQEVGTWPLINILCKLGRVSFVSRQRHSTAKEQTDLEKRLKNGDSLILFPEGTSTDGSHLRSFLSSFFILAKPLITNQDPDQLPIIQPISVAYDRLDTLPVTRFIRSTYCWYGDMELMPHLLNLCQHSDMHASIIFHQPLYPENFKNRKEIAKQTWNIISKGTIALRTNASDQEIQKII